MQYYYSPSRNGFYVDDIHGTPGDGITPEDAVAIETEAYGALLAAQATGQSIGPNQDGGPAVGSPSMTDADHAFAARNALEGSDRTVLRCAEHGIPVPADWIAYRAALRAIVAGKATALPARPGYPQGT